MVCSCIIRLRGEGTDLVTDLARRLYCEGEGGGFERLQEDRAYPELLRQMNGRRRRTIHSVPRPTTRMPNVCD
jgi:hypothetical protein